MHNIWKAAIKNYSIFFGLSSSDFMITGFQRELGSVWFQTWTVGMLFSREDHHDVAFLFPQFLKIHLNSIKLKISDKAVSPHPHPSKTANRTWSGLPKACTHRVVSFKKFLLCGYCQGLCGCVFSLLFPATLGSFLSGGKGWALTSPGCLQNYDFVNIRLPQRREANQIFILYILFLLG